MVILHSRRPSSEPFQVFVVVLIQIRRMRANSPAGSRSGLVQELKGVASLTLLLGLTWIFGFFTWGPARVFLLYLFSGLNSLQGQRKPTFLRLGTSWSYAVTDLCTGICVPGLFIFLFHCLMKESVRRQWRDHLCFGPFQLDESSGATATRDHCVDDFKLRVIQ